jgi:hypothetical protein
LKNLTQTMGIVEQINGQMTFLPLTEFYQRTIDAAILDITSGAFDYNSVLRRTVNTLVRSGIRTIDYASGYSSRVAVAARRAVMTGITQMTGRITDYNAEKLGAKYYEVAWHANARPSHRVWQGKVWSKEQLVTVCGLGSVTGLCGVNCYHEYYPFFPGISERNWTDEWLREQNAKEDMPRTWRGKEYTAYEATQKQRQMETSMRAQRQKVRCLKEGGANPDDIVIEKARYQGQLQEYKRFCNDMGLTPQMDRVYIDGLGRVAPGKTLYSIVNGGGNGIINQKDYTVPRGVGAAAKKYNVRLPEGDHGTLKEASKITKIKTFAGKGTGKEIRERYLLEAEYDHPADNWQKNRGEAIVIVNGRERKAEIHWYEADGDKVKMKVKRYLDEG